MQGDMLLSADVCVGLRRMKSFRQEFVQNGDDSSCKCRQTRLGIGHVLIRAILYKSIGIFGGKELPGGLKNLVEYGL
jgi:hypothetical protein